MKNDALAMNDFQEAMKQHYQLVSRDIGDDNNDEIVLEMIKGKCNVC